MKSIKLLIAFAFITTLSYAQNDWLPTNGPYGGHAKCLLFIGNQLFAGTECGLFSTTDNGVVWESKNTGIPPCTEIRSLSYNNSLLVAGTNAGIFISTNDGGNWTSANTGLTDLNVYCTFFNGTDILVGTITGVFKSSNNGTSWSYSSLGIPGGSNSLNFIKKGIDIFVGTSSGVYKSSDNGFTWSLSNTGLTTFVGSFAVIGSTIFAGTNDGLYSTINNGVNWTLVPSNLPTGYAVGLYYNGSALYVNSGAGFVYKSINNGITWTAINNFIGNCFAFNNSTLYLGGNLFSGNPNVSGIYMATNNESNWFSIGLGYGVKVNELHSYGSNLLCGTKNGIYKTLDQGNVWSSVNNGLPINSNVQSISSISNILLAGTSTNGVFKSNDNGNTWIQSNSGLTVSGMSFLNITKISSIGSIIYLGAQQIVSGSAPQGCVFKSNDNGNTWIQSNNGLGIYIQVLDISSSGPVVYLATNAGVYLSTNNGNSWIAANTGMPINSIYSITANSTNIFAAHRYGGTSSAPPYGGVFTSSDYGSSWGNNNFIPPYQSVHSLLNVNEDIYAGWAVGVMKSIDNGNTWISTGNGLPDAFVKSLAENQDDIFAGVSGGDSYSLPIGVYKSGVILKTNDLKDIISNNIFPNPTTSKISVKSNSEFIGKKFMIYDQLGKEVKSGIITSENTEIDLSNLTQGMYLFKIDADMTESFKIIKQ
jgi:ligand-binding sensor domain-containing protein